MEKPQLLFIHGFRGNHLGLKDTIKVLEKAGYKCFAPDIPPAFNTKKEKNIELTSFTADGYAKWVADYILEHKLDRPILVGHSMGSIICAATADRYPELINEKMVLASPICVTPPKFICNLAPLTAIMPNKFIGYVTTKYLIIPKDKKTLKNVLAQTYECAKKFTSKRDTAKAAKFSISFAISDFNFDKDTLFIAGKKDKLNSNKQVKDTAKKFKGETIFIEDAGHLINYECPEILAEKIKTWIEK
jgi:pimeloyl-ACP methyl ester carboxylesterase